MMLFSSRINKLFSFYHEHLLASPFDSSSTEEEQKIKLNDLYTIVYKPGLDLWQMKKNRSIDYSYILEHQVFLEYTKLPNKPRIFLSAKVVQPKVMSYYSYNNFFQMVFENINELINELKLSKEYTATTFANIPVLESVKKTYFSKYSPMTKQLSLYIDMIDRAYDKDILKIRTLLYTRYQNNLKEEKENLAKFAKENKFGKIEAKKKYYANALKKYEANKKAVSYEIASLKEAEHLPNVLISIECLLEECNEFKKFITSDDTMLQTKNIQSNITNIKNCIKVIQKLRVK